MMNYLWEYQKMSFGASSTARNSAETTEMVTQNSISADNATAN